jgi:hypothetical protein
LRYANGDPTRTLSVYVNNVKISQISLPTTGSWDTWGDLITALSLNSGTNTIKYQHDSGDSGAVNLDYITVPDTGGGTVDTPTFSPVAGTYTSTQSVTISTATSGATIYYTTNGSTPTTSSTLYSSPVSISTTTTLKAIAVKSGMTNSAVGTAVYNITGDDTFNDTSTGTGQNQFEYVGTWNVTTGLAGNYLDDDHHSQATNDYYNFDFTGTQVKVYSQKSGMMGIIAYSIDGGAETNVDQYNSTTSYNTLVYTSPMLTNASHTLKVRVTGTKNASSTKYYAVADRVVITSLKSAMINTSSGEVAGIEDMQNANECIIYPNPGNGHFSLKSNYKIKAVEIYNVSGRKIKTLNSINEDRIEAINISEMPNGIYFIRLFDGGKYYTEKLIINN